MDCPKDRLLNCAIKEEPENLEIIYDIKGDYPFADIRKRTKTERLCILVDEGGPLSLREEYTFSLEK